MRRRRDCTLWPRNWTFGNNFESEQHFQQQLRESNESVSQRRKKWEGGTVPGVAIEVPDIVRIAHELLPLPLADADLTE
jgi:hypothetical protein